MTFSESHLSVKRIFIYPVEAPVYQQEITIVELLETYGKRVIFQHPVHHKRIVFQGVGKLAA
jgi:hypothetical protein